MASRDASEPTVVSIPSQEADRPSWMRIGIIAGVCFVVGVAWPRLAGIRAGPALPESALGSAPSTPPPATPSVGVAPVDAPTGSALVPALATTPSASAVRSPANGDATREGPPADSLRQGAYHSVQIEWPMAIVRDAPRDGKIVARLPKGTSVRIGPAKSGWYPIRYGEAVPNEGWVYRGAIGR
jgi:hypothetical protein